MQYTKTKTVTYTEKELEKVVCDRCGKTGNGYGTDIQEQEFTFGYGSKFDLSEIKFDLCDDCIEDFLNLLQNYKTKEII